MRTIAAVASLTICCGGIVVSACGVANSERLVELPPEREPWAVAVINGHQIAMSDASRLPDDTLDHVVSEDGGVLVWGEWDETKGKMFFYERRVEASDPNADENRLPWDMERVGKTPPEGWKLEDYID